MDVTETIARVLSTAATTEAGVGSALDAILAATGTTCGTVHLLEGDGATLRLVAARQIPPPVLEKIQVIPIGKGMAGVAVETKQPVTTCNLQTDDAGGVIRQGARATGVQGALALPMLRGEAVVGALGVATREPRDFSRVEIDRLLEIGRALADAVASRS
jgi:signal transduction protein with GAF and PtsI domain